MKIFKSLNCIVCEAPFTPVTNQPRSPMALWCGKAMCEECFYREKSTKEADRKHQCESGDGCFDDPIVASFLMDVLSQGSLKLSPMGDGYLLCKPFKFPECTICHDEYASTLEGKSPFLLPWCSHVICTSCCKNTRRLNEGPTKDWEKYEIKCPICSVVAPIQDDEGTEQKQAQSNSELKDFMTELPEMTRQWEDTYRFCEECKTEQPIEDMFYCEGCEKNICASCGYKKHRSHKTFVVVEMEATKIADQLQKRSSNYKDLFPKLHKELVDDIGAFGTKLLSKEETLKQTSDYQDLRELNTKFEATSEEYITHLREYDARVKDLIKSLDDDIN